MHQPIILFISGAEIAFILFIDIKHEITKSAEKHGIDTSITSDVKKELDKVKDDLDDFTGSVKRKL